MTNAVTHPSLESSFGHLLVFALKTWVDIGRFKGRRLDDLLFNEYDQARDGDFSGWVLNAEYEDWQPGARMWGKPFPQHRDIMWPLLVIQAATYSRDPELIAAILEAEMDYELTDIAANEWHDQFGLPAPLFGEEVDDDQRAVMAWPSGWRRVFGGETPAT